MVGWTQTEGTGCAGQDSVSQLSREAHEAVQELGRGWRAGNRNLGRAGDWSVGDQQGT